MKLSWGLLLFLGFAGTDAKKDKDKEKDEPKTANQKLKKLTRDTMKIMNYLYTTEVTKDQMQNMNMLGRGNGERKRLTGDNGMVSHRLYKRMLQKYLNQIKYIRKKINSLDCGEFSDKKVAEDMRKDAWEVWGDHSANDLEEKLQDLFSQGMTVEEAESFFKEGTVFGKNEDAPFNMLWTQIPAFLIPDGAQNTQAVRGIKSNKDKPLTLLSIQFMKTRLFIQEYVGKCYDEEIAMTVTKKNEKARKRVANWVNKGQRKFNTMEERVCQNLWRGFIRTMPDDNPYGDLDSADGCKCKPEEGKKTLQCMAKLKDAERKAANAAKREERQKNKKGKQVVEDAE